MAQPTAYRHEGRVLLNRHDGTLVRLTMEEAAAIVAVVSPSADARAAAERHLVAHASPLGRRHGDPYVE